MDDELLLKGYQKLLAARLKSLANNIQEINSFPENFSRIMNW